MIALCTRCEKIGHDARWEETCLGGWGTCDACGRQQGPNPAGPPHVGEHRSLAYFKATREMLVATRSSTSATKGTP